MMNIEKASNANLSFFQNPSIINTGSSGTHGKLQFNSRLSHDEIKLASAQANNINRMSINDSDTKIIKSEGKHMILNNDNDLKKSVNTVACNNKGGFKVHYARGEYAEENKEIKECIAKHEEKHIEQIKRTAPNICKGGQDMDGRVVRLTDKAVFEGLHISYEKEAWKIGISCLEEKRKSEEKKDKPDIDLFSDLMMKELSWKNRYREMFGEIYGVPR